MNSIVMSARLRILVFGFLFLLSAILAPVSTQATDTSWIGGVGDWGTSSNWSQYVVPVDGDNVYITQSGALVNYNILDSLSLGNILMISGGQH